MQGKIHAYIYTLTPIAQKIKQLFKGHSKANIKLIECDLPYNLFTFNILLTSKNFWDNIPSIYTNLFVLYNPKGLKINIALKDKYNIPFTLYPLKTCNTMELYVKNPLVIDEHLQEGFLFHIQNKFAKYTIQKCTKSKILSIRKEYKMLNNESIERQKFISFYLYFWHYMIDLGYNF